MAETSILEVLTRVGALAGLAAFIWRLAEVYRSWLHISVDCQRIQHANAVRIRTTVENKGAISKNLNSAFLLIGPEKEHPEETVGALMHGGELNINQFDSLNKMVDHIAGFLFKGQNALRVYDDKCDHVLLPLPYYFRENAKVGVETLAFERYVALAGFSRTTTLAVRFYVRGRWRLHRNVQATFDTFSDGQTAAPSASASPLNPN